MKRDTILKLKLPRGGVLEDYAVREPKQFSKPAKPFNRIRSEERRVGKECRL